MKQRVSEAIQGMSHLPDPLIVIAGENDQKKTAVLLSLADEGVGPYWNLSEVLATYMASHDLTEVPRPAEVVDFLGPADSRVWFWDHLDFLFWRPFRIRVEQWLLQASQRHPLVVAWPGEERNGVLFYSRASRPDHYRSPRVSRFPVISDT